MTSTLPRMAYTSWRQMHWDSILTKAFPYRIYHTHDNQKFDDKMFDWLLNLTYH